MKKIIIMIMAVIMMMAMASCTERRVSKGVIAGTNDVDVIEQTIKNGEVIDETHYTITYESAEEAWNSIRKR